MPRLSLVVQCERLVCAGSIAMAADKAWMAAPAGRRAMAAVLLQVSPEDLPCIFVLRATVVIASF